MTQPTTKTYYSVNYCTTIDLNNYSGWVPGATKYLYVNIPNSAGIFSMVSFNGSTGAPGVDTRVVNVITNGEKTSFTSPSPQNINIYVSGDGNAPGTYASGTTGGFGLILSASSLSTTSINGTTKFNTYTFSFVGILPNTITNTGDPTVATNFITLIDPVTGK